MNTITCQCDLLDDDLIEAGWTCYPCYQYGKDNPDAAYSVWVGGVEVNDYYLTQLEAQQLAAQYTRDGYTDAIVRKEN